MLLKYFDWVYIGSGTWLKEFNKNEASASKSAYVKNKYTNIQKFGISKVFNILINYIIKSDNTDMLHKRILRNSSQLKILNSTTVFNINNS